MKHMSTYKRNIGLAAVLGLSALFAGMTTGASAQSDSWRDRHDNSQYRHDDSQYRQDNMQYRYDRQALRRDQAHLRDLQNRRDSEARRHDWNDVHQLDNAIRNTRWRIQNRRYDANHDLDSYYSSSDRDWFYHHGR